MAKKATKRNKRVMRQPNARATFPKAKGNPKRKGVTQPPREAKKKARRPNAQRLPMPAPRELGLLDLAQEAYIDIEVLAQEMREWANNIEERFSTTAKYEEVSQAADELENINDPTEGYTTLNDYKITWQDPRPTRRLLSRSARAGQACDMMRAVEEKLRELDGEIPEDNPAHDEAQGLADEIENDVNEIESVSFPGMF